MRILWVVLLASCYRESSSSAPPAQQSPPPEQTAKSNDVRRTMPSVGPATCTADGDCRLGYAGAACCPSGGCPSIVSAEQVAAYQAYCDGVKCPLPQPSSSCMGVMGLKPTCKNGLCEGVR